ncbi:MAG TPA: FAD:protein FMN transferase [Burkholderiaceae bacterium]|nr:FAD:protein FMN transferase [Burkholderiaceae bacterium]
MLNGMRNLAQAFLERAAVSGKRRSQAPAGWLVREQAIMGTAIRVELWCDDRPAGEAACAAVMREMHRIDAAMSPFKPDSELSHINRVAAHRAAMLTEEMFGLLQKSIAFSRMSDGAFDITFASVGQLYDYRKGIRPTDAQLEAARSAVGYQNLILDPQARTVRFAHPGTQIDLGGFAKGYAVDNGAAILRRHGIAHGIVTAGGDSHIVGDRRGRPWAIGIRDPRRAGEVVAMLPLEDTALSTSGDYERFFEVDGMRFHHVIDPRTGKSPSHVHSVTVIAEDGLTTEAFSKCVFVKGVQKGLQFIESRPGVDAVIVDDMGVLHYTTGLLDDVPRGHQ